MKIFVPPELHLVVPCSPLKVNRCFGEHIASIFMVEEYALFFETEDRGDQFLRNISSFSTITLLYTLEDQSLHNHRCENVKPRNIFFSEHRNEIKKGDVGFEVFYGGD
jgi:hypothetical protein